MKKIFLSLFFILISSSAFAQSPFMGRCHMDYCSWIKIKEQKLIKEEGAARLYEVRTDYGSSYHPSVRLQNGSYPKSYSKRLKVEWSSEKGSHYIFCYNRLPVFQDGDNPFVLDFTMIAGAGEAAANEYVKICYGSEPYSWEKKSFLKKYHLGSPITDEVKIKSPMDLFTYVKN